VSAGKVGGRGETTGVLPVLVSSPPESGSVDAARASRRIACLSPSWSLRTGKDERWPMHAAQLQALVGEL